MQTGKLATVLAILIGVAPGVGAGYWAGHSAGYQKSEVERKERARDECWIIENASMADSPDVRIYRGLQYVRNVTSCYQEPTPSPMTRRITS